ncbi:MAG: ferredoxin--NADP(+) reductase [Deltaproteobacteria bacterium]|nr:ferredoxin--NADP(+) reductase [Deltaproteobacteria bacterium]HCH66444.1 ferredoxin--NADP(+) reductase [Deltaproteobacteria bacterium]
MAAPAHTLTVTHVEHYTESYFRLRTTRPEGLRFVSGQFIMLGMALDSGPLMRAYSIASPAWDEELEFYSIIIQDGALTSRLQHIKEGSEVILSAKAVGSLTLRGLASGGRRLFLLSTGTGFAPFACLIRDEEVYNSFDQVILTQTCRYVKDLQYGFDRVAEAKACPLVGEEASAKLVHYPTVTREPYKYEGRITHLMESGKVFEDLGIPGFDPATDRAMICGSHAMLLDTQKVLDAVGLTRGSLSKPGGYVWERAFTG